MWPFSLLQYHRANNIIHGRVSIHTASRAHGSR